MSNIGDSTKRLVIFGAGNIGRSFIGQLFSRAGYEVVFVDIDPVLICELNRKGRYRVVVKQSGLSDEEIVVDHVRAVDGTNTELVAGEVAGASLVATAVGKGALPYIFPVLASGIDKRIAAGRGGLDIIIAENVRDAAAWFRKEIHPSLPSVPSPDSVIGLVETSIGKMVPIMTADDRKIDPLQVFAEAYNTLIVDAKGFRNGMPSVPGLQPVENIQAYVDRKLFIHNLGHAATAYFGFLSSPERRYVYEHIQDRAIAERVRKCMHESAAALAMEYPDDLSMVDLEEHIDDLIARFGNNELKDTVHRVGRDLKRKLSRDDRVSGAMILAAGHGLPFDVIASVAAAAFSFKAPDEEGNLFPADEEFLAEVARDGVDRILDEVCKLPQACKPRVSRYIADLSFKETGERR